MFARFRASRLVFCSLAILLLVAACVPIPPPAHRLPLYGSPTPAPAAPVADRLVFARQEGATATEACSSSTYSSPMCRGPAPPDPLGHAADFGRRLLVRRLTRRPVDRVPGRGQQPGDLAGEH